MQMTFETQYHQRFSSPDHSTTIGHILNLRTSHISPQFHCVYDDQFSTVSSVPISEGGYLDDEVILTTVWDKLLKTGLERVLDDEDEYGQRQPQPELSNEWLSPAE